MPRDRRRKRFPVITRRRQSSRRRAWRWLRSLRRLAMPWHRSLNWQLSQLMMMLDCSRITTTHGITMLLLLMMRRRRRRLGLCQHQTAAFSQSRHLSPFHTVSRSPTYHTTCLFVSLLLAGRVALHGYCCRKMSVHHTPVLCLNGKRYHHTFFSAL